MVAHPTLWFERFNAEPERWGILAIFALLWFSLNGEPTGLFERRGLDLLIGFRGLFPMLVAVGLLGVLWWRRFRTAPGLSLWLLGAYGTAGALATILFAADRGRGVYWALAFLSVPIVGILASAVARPADRFLDLLALNWSFVVAYVLLYAGIGLLQFDLAGTLWGADRARLFGTMPDQFISALSVTANGVGRMAGLLVLFCLTKLLFQSSYRLLWGALLVVGVVMLYATISRTAMLATIAGVLLLVALRFGFTTAFAAGIAAGIALLAMPGAIGYLTRGEGIVGLLAFSNRVETWRESMGFFRMSPLVGLGFHADRFLVGQHVHNAWIHALIQAGLVGFAFFAAAWLVSWRRVFQLGLARRFLNHEGEERVRLVEATLLLFFLSIRSVSESAGAFFGIDLLLLVPVMGYLAARWRSVELVWSLSSVVRSDRGVPFFRILDTPVSAVRMDDALRFFEDTINERRQEHVLVCSVNMIMQSRRDTVLRKALLTAGLVAPDGYPLTKVGQWRGHGVGRVRGTDLVRAFSEISARKGYRCFFYGGAPGVPERMAESLVKAYPGLVIAGTYSPPFRRLDPEEDDAIVRMINESQADVVWIGLGCPKQERWALEHRGTIRASCLVAVGAAFDFIAGTKREAPVVFQRLGIEWAWRLAQDPARLWRRVFIEGPWFLALVAWESLARMPGTRVRGGAPRAEG